MRLDRKPGLVDIDARDQEPPSPGSALLRSVSSCEPHPLLSLVSPQTWLILSSLFRKPQNAQEVLASFQLSLLPSRCPGSSGPIRSPHYRTGQEAH